MGHISKHSKGARFIAFFRYILSVILVSAPPKLLELFHFEFLFWNLAYKSFRNTMMQSKKPASKHTLTHLHTHWHSCFYSYSLTESRISSSSRFYFVTLHLTKAKKNRGFRSCLRWGRLMLIGAYQNLSWTWLRTVLLGKLVLKAIVGVGAAYIISNSWDQRSKTLSNCDQGEPMSQTVFKAVICRPLEWDPDFSGVLHEQQCSLQFFRPNCIFIHHQHQNHQHQQQ